jgi:Pyridoxamine 5'-phosphate oxidase
MATRTTHEEANVGTGSKGMTGAVPEDDVRWMGGSCMTSEEVWQSLAKSSFAILSYVTPSGEPRSSGVVYKTIGRRLYVAVAPDSWKAKHVAASGRVAMTVPVRRGGILSLVLPIPPATVSFYGRAIVHPAGSPQVRSLLKELGSLLPAERQVSGSIIEVVPEGEFLTYALGIPLRKMRDPAAAQARVAVSQEGKIR